MRCMRLTAVLALLCVITFSFPASAQQRSFDVSAYQRYLEAHRDMAGSALLNEYPAPLLNAKVKGLAGSVLFADSIIQKYGITPAEQELLLENGFMVTERLTAPTFMDAYEDIWHKDLPVMVTTDAILHAVHMSYDRILMDSEIGHLGAKLNELLSNLERGQEHLENTYGNNPEMRPMLLDVDVFVTIARSLLALDPQTSSTPLKPRYDENTVQVAELYSLIKTEAPAQYPLFSSTPRIVDFSQFTVRGHYTLETWLGQYFRTMMWLGRTELMLTKPVQQGMPGQKDEDIRRQIIDAYLLVEALRAGGGDEPLREMDRFLGLLIGESDNVRIGHLDELANDLGIQSPEQLLNPVVADAFQALLVSKPFADQRINSQILYSDPMNPEQLKPPSAFLLLGQRFIIDSYVFSNVVYDRIMYQNQKVRRMLPSSMDALFALGNDAAAQFLQDEFSLYPYASHLASLRYLIDSYDEEFWSSSLYNSWLHSIRALNVPDNVEALPAFMQTAAWWQQKMNTQLASWAQLRHDNLLYAKQSYSGGITCSYPEVYVEPFPEMYGRLADFANQAITAFDGITNAAWIKSYFKHLARSMDTLRMISEKELAGQALEQYEIDFGKSLLFLRGMCGLIFDGWYYRLFYGERAYVEDYITADVHTAPTDAAGNPVGWVYHVGTGKVNLGVAIADIPGTGAVAFMAPMLSYHEHVTTNFERLTDEAWKQMLMAGDFSRPVWTNNYLADANGDRRAPGPSLFTQVTNVERIPEPAYALTIGAVYPQPAQSDQSVMIAFSVTQPRITSVTLSVHDISGRRVRTLLTAPVTAGAYISRWDGADDHGQRVPAGTYTAVLDGGGERVARTVVVIK